MNIFILDENPRISSTYHVDKHVVKMPLETAQLLSTCVNYFGGNALYKSTHINHPCNVWLRQSLDNFLYLAELGVYLCEEYAYRYNKKHKCLDVILDCVDKAPNISFNGLTEFALAMPEECKIGDAVSSYREYYNKHKTHLFNWSNRQVPQFIEYAK